MEESATKEQGMNYELGNAPIGRLLLRLAIPSVLAQLVTLLYTIIDRVYIGHIEGIGEDALTGVGLCMPIVCILSAFVNLIGQGGAPQASIAMGKQDMEKAEKILGNCMAALVGIAVLITLFFTVFGRSLLMVFGASEKTIPYAYSYMQIYVLGSIFLMISMGMNQFITAQGFTRYSMVSVLLGAISNIVLDPIFIFGLGWGVRGAAFATVLSQALASIFVLWFLNSVRSTLRICKQYFRMESKIMLPVLALGVSPFIMQATEAALNLSFNYSLQKYGGDAAVGAMTIASTIMQMIWIPTAGIGQGAQPIISYNYGAGNAGRVKKSVGLLFLFAESYMFLCWAAVELFPQVFIRMFSNSTGELYMTAVWVVRLYIAAIGLFGIQNTVQQTFISTGQAKASIFIACLRKVVLLIPFIFILPCFFENKVFAVFLAEPVSDMISITTAGLIFAWKFPKMMKKLEKGAVSTSVES